MKSIEIEGKTYNCPESYDEVTMEDYIKFFNGIEITEDEENNILNTGKLISNILGISFEEVMELPVTTIYNIRDSIYFLNTKLEPEGKEFIILDDEVYSIQEPDKMSYRQMIDAESIASEGENRENFIKLASYLFTKEGEKYNPDKVHEIEEKIKKAKVTEVIPYVLDFIKKKLSYVQDIQTYFQKVEELKATLENIQTSENNTPQS